jgi:hypothetical protein
MRPSIRSRNRNRELHSRPLRRVGILAFDALCKPQEGVCDLPEFVTLHWITNGLGKDKTVFGAISVLPGPRHIGARVGHW